MRGKELPQEFTNAFSRKSKEIIRKRDGGKSVLSGSDKHIEMSHIDHSKKKPNYDDPSNGRCLTTLEHYYDHYNRHGYNGLTKAQNIWALKQIWNRLTEEEKRGVPNPNTLKKKNFL